MFYPLPFPIPPFSPPPTPPHLQKKKKKKRNPPSYPSTSVLTIPNPPHKTAQHILSRPRHNFSPHVVSQSQRITHHIRILFHTPHKVKFSPNSNSQLSVPPPQKKKIKEQEQEKIPPSIGEDFQRISRGGGVLRVVLGALCHLDLSARVLILYEYHQTVLLEILKTFANIYLFGAPLFLGGRIWAFKKKKEWVS